MTEQRTINDQNQRDHVVVELRKLVTKEGSLPPERYLSEEYGVNRYVVRQAIRTLRDEGTVPPSDRSRQRLWRHEHVIQNTNPPDLWETRLSFEPQIARLAAMYGTPQELRRIADLHAQSNPERFDKELDAEFHSAIGVASHNRLASYLIDRITDIARDSSFRLRHPPLTRETGYRHHDAIVTALLDRRGAAAEREMARHLRAITVWSKGLAPEEDA
ncbi:FadR/GntR family transcriptional regulator [Pseudoruegeria sp. HB172150]|uniref:FadR/GntR family transcriptional regulator n=1 Tax=Pseudoruegeria sp. HB172150 TaxID=2721164 RepID=UPI001553B466|nr:FCD domain-containing protein [Pseudoruegeria sp. HB172150]